jgi:putative nucleotidyltransferase with HDIG domain
VDEKDSTQTPPQPNVANNIVPGTDKLDAYIDRIKVLPPRPSLMIKLLPLFKQPNPDLDEVVRLVSRDPALTTEILKLCNSAQFRGEKVVADISEASARLGFIELYRIIMMVSATRTISLDNIESVLELEALCRHAIATALAAAVIARAVGEAEDSAFVAGLLHDVGKIALASAQGVSYKNLAREVARHGGSLSEAEKKNFGFDHSEVGSRLLERWGFPPEVVAVVRYHHNVAEAGEFQRLTATVDLANQFAKDEEKKPATSAGSAANNSKAIAILNLDPALFSTITEQVRAALKRDAGAFMAAPRNAPKAQ